MRADDLGGGMEIHGAEANHNLILRAREMDGFDDRRRHLLVQGALQHDCEGAVLHYCEHCEKRSVAHTTLKHHCGDDLD